MPTVSSLAQLTFSNLGPLTTTFTAPSSCSTLDVGYTGVAYDQDPSALAFDKDCSVEYSAWDCIPEGSMPSPTATIVNPAVDWEVKYFSPGLYCPSGWKTVGVASRNGDSAVTSAGAFANTSAIPTYEVAAFPIGANVLMQALDPSETAVICCPSSMTGATYLGCYSTLPSVTLTAGCARFYPTEDLKLITETYLFDGVTVVGEMESLIATSPATRVSTYTIPAADMYSLVAISVEPMVTLVHKANDVKATGTGAATTSNAAMNLSSRSSWDGLGGIVAVSVLGLILGAAIIVPL